MLPNGCLVGTHLCGRGSIALGLVDQIGYLDDTIGKRPNLPAPRKCQVVVYRRTNILMIIFTIPTAATGTLR